MIASLNNQAGRRYTQFGNTSPGGMAVPLRVTGSGGAVPPPPPTPTVTSGNVGGTDWRDWRWFDGQELRPNWYEYPEVQKIKKAIVRAAKAKKKVERQLSFAKGQDDLQGLLATLNDLQDRLAALMESYREGLKAWQGAVTRRRVEDAQREADEEAEFMEMLGEIL